MWLQVGLCVLGNFPASCGVKQRVKSMLREMEYFFQFTGITVILLLHYCHFYYC